MKEKKCKLCGELFTPECASNVICKRDHFRSCPVCGKQILWNSTAAIKPCSKECSKELTRRRNIEKYGVAHPMQSKEVQQHHRQAMLDKYGVESPLQSAELKQKAIETNREKFGSDWALSNKEVKKKAEQTMTERYGGATTLESPILRRKVEETLISRYGVDNPMQLESIQQKASNTCFRKYGVTNPMQDRAIARKSGDTRRTVQDSNLAPVFNSCEDRANSFIAALSQRGVTAEYINFNTICIPDQQTCILISPSSIYNAQQVPASHNIERMKIIQNTGYRCIHVFDWDDWDKIINLISPKQKIYARQCEIYRLNIEPTDEFLNNYHLQGTVKGQIISLGLVKNSELLQVMTFGNPRYDKHYYSELLRLCTKPGYMIVGGAEKLFSFATKQLTIDEIISYCDLSKFSGAVYNRIGMKLKRVTEPQEVWSRGNRKITANLLRQRGYDQLFNSNYGKETSNEALMLQDGWLPVYDCGQAVYTFSTTQ